ncbi:MAG: hypothetical protein OHK005_08310 [Candidatus Methylacidiphilales bacterium]
MKLRLSALGAGALLIVAAIALILPWLRLNRPEPGAALRPLEVARQLAGEDEDFLHGYVGMRRAEWTALVDAPFSGVSLVEALRAPESEGGPGVLMGGWAEAFLGPTGSPLRLIWFLPVLLAVLLLLALLPKKLDGRVLTAVALCAACAYVGARAWANHTFADRVLLAMELGSGWWLTVYGLVPLAVLAGARAMAGKKAKW